jgi:hypothetical protein
LVVLTAAAAVMIPNAAVRTGAAFVLGICVFLGILTIVVFYVPAAIAAALAAYATPRKREQTPQSPLSLQQSVG